MSDLAALVFAAVATGQPLAPAGNPLLTPHALAVKQFASTLAIGDVASSQCADILVNMQMVDSIRDQLGMTVDDRPALKIETDLAIGVFTKAFREAPSPQVWCDAAYRMYGPEGQMIRGFMLRSAPNP